MDEPRPTKAEMARLVGMLQDTGLVEVVGGDDGHKAYRTTVDGMRVGHMLAVGDEVDANSMLAL